VIPSTQDLEAIGQLSEGQLSDCSFAAILCALWMAERTAVLEVRRHQLQKQIVLENGIPVEAVSNLLHETIGKFLVQRGTIDDETYHQCLAEAAAAERSMEEVLIAKGCISHFDLFKVMQQCQAQKLLDCFAWRDGSFSIHADLPEVQSPLKVKVPQLILTGVASFAAQEEVDAGIAPLVGKRLVVHPAPHVDAASMKLNTKQSRLLMDIGSGARLDELTVGSQLAPEEVTRLIYSLTLLGAIILEDHLPAPTTPALPAEPDPAPQPVAPVTVEPEPDPEPAIAPEPDQPAVEAPAAHVPTGEALEALRDEIMQAYLEHRRKDAFELLGLTIDAKPGAIESAYMEYSRKYAPWGYEGRELESLAEKAQDLFLAGARAYAELSDPARRKALVEKRRQRVNKPKKKSTRDYFAIKTDLLDSEAQYSNGIKLVEEKKFEAAIPLLEFAVDCDHQNAAYAAELAFCRYQADHSLAGRSVEALQDAVKLDPDCGIAVYYLGELQRILGDAEGAEPHLRKACKLMQRDRRPTEALKRLLTRKR
jgi:hypothetical protein